MCGIIGYVGKKHNVIDVLIMGLKSLEYRGYDSSGVALWNDTDYKLIKAAGRISNLENKLLTENLKDAKLGIGHTRWATHGQPNDINAHPHHVRSITLVHNGIIENYQELKEELIKKGYHFVSDTDTEIVAALLDSLNTSQNKINILQELTTKLRGSYALGIVFNDDPNHLYCLRKDSPLIIGVGQDENFIASDIPAIIKYTKDYILLNYNEIAQISDQEIQIYDFQNNLIEKEINHATWDVFQAEKNGYDHFMLKEIMEEDKVIKDTIMPLITDEQTLLKNMPDFSKYEQIHIVACGSAMYAGMIGKYLIEEYGNIKTECYVASEYRYQKNFFTPNTLVILVSQSGETADTIAAMRLAHNNNLDTLAIVNAYKSTIAREASNVLYINAGPEIAVATTKAYTLQVAMLSLIAFTIAINNNTLTDVEKKAIFHNYQMLPTYINSILNKQEDYFNIAKDLVNINDLFYIGRGIDYAISLEGSLKLKEISYIHSEAYQAGELKHGTISLIEENTPVIAIITDPKLAEKMISNIKEVKARGAKITLVITEELDKDFDFCDNKIVIPSLNPLLQPILVVPPLQLLAYETAKLKGCDIDKPRNLAKSVTVE